MDQIFTLAAAPAGTLLSANSMRKRCWPAGKSSASGKRLGLFFKGCALPPSMEKVA